MRWKQAVPCLRCNIQPSHHHHRCATVVRHHCSPAVLHQHHHFKPMSYLPPTSAASRPSPPPPECGPTVLHAPELSRMQEALSKRSRNRTTRQTSRVRGS
ncbi:hypothetical protein AVEN_171538-1 [Araneus ventricosus]|uniref:Uncharacterized protein n=1 Tax=Araneus ventricosus TaxID=182803 RepID=A0A4Y2R4X9_ARAVE|nr:hypothetical protein AVEN_171538-1 [Araneus ventricosus]